MRPVSRGCRSCCLAFGRAPTAAAAALSMQAWQTPPAAVAACRVLGKFFLVCQCPSHPVCPPLFLLGVFSAHPPRLHRLHRCSPAGVFGGRACRASRPAAADFRAACPATTRCENATSLWRRRSDPRQSQAGGIVCGRMGARLLLEMFYLAAAATTYQCYVVREQTESAAVPHG